VSGYDVGFIFFLIVIAIFIIHLVVAMVLYGD